MSRLNIDGNGNAIGNNFNFIGPYSNVVKGNFNVIHDTVILQSFVEPLRIIEIKDEVMVSVFKNYFDIMWKQGKEIK